jgi:hypothetical protein
MLVHQNLASWYIGISYKVNVGVVLALAIGASIGMLLSAKALDWLGGGLLVGCGISCLWVAHANGWLTSHLCPWLRSHSPTVWGLQPSAHIWVQFGVR